MTPVLRQRRRTRLFLLVNLLLLAPGGLLFGSCDCRHDFPEVKVDDAGDRAWVRQVVPILLGRKVKGYAEVKLLADLVQQTDRATVLRGLMQEPEFNEHWSEVLVDNLRVQREGTIEHQAQSDCFGAPLRAGAPDPALALHVLGNAPSTAAPGGAFNMSDLVRSAVAADNLAALFPTDLFAVEHHELRFSGEQQLRDDHGRDFGEVFLNRQNTCLACHNSDSSTTGSASGWLRWYPIAGSFEQALYGQSFGGDPLAIHEVFRSDQHRFAAEAGFTEPWGMTGCGFFKADMGSAAGSSPYFTGPLAPGATVTTLAALFKQGYDGLKLDGLNRSVPSATQAACDTCSHYCSGSAPLDPESVVNGPFVRDLLTAHGGGTDCGSCHGGIQGLWFYDSMPPAGERWYSHLINIPSGEDSSFLRVKPGDAANSMLVKKLRGTGPGSRMPQGGGPLPEGDIQKVEQWINALPPQGATCTNCPTLSCDPTHLDHSTEAFAYLTAAHVVEIVWKESMGYPLTIANYFPRAYGQRGALWNLTEYHFIPSGWSLRELLVRILTANTFNRKPPDVQTFAGTPYVEPTLYDPWVPPDPRISPANQPGWHPSDHPDLYGNAMTDGIYRYSTWSLLRSAQKAMDWQGPKRFPDTSYPSSDLVRAVGQYLSAESPGFRVTNFPALLAWEKEHGACANHRSSGQDWVDRLAAATAAFVPAPGDPPLKLRDALAVERDWLLSDATFAPAPPPLSQTEEQALAAVVGSLDAQISSLTAAELQQKLRSVCGLLLETPQFFLAGVASDAPGGATRLRVCNGAPCTYQEMCQEITSHIPLGGGSLWRCEADSVGSVGLRPIRDYVAIDRAFCPECPVISLDPRGCFRQGGPLEKTGPELACRATPPACDPRCSTIDCCGAPLSPLDTKGTLLLSAEGATVRSAEAVRIRRASTGKVEALGARETLKTGDVLELPPSATLVLDNAGRTMSRKGSSSAPEGTGPRYVLVTGPQVLQAADRIKGRPPLTAGELEWLRTRGWRQNPDGSTPIKPTPGSGAPGAAEKLWAEWLKKRGEKR